MAEAKELLQTGYHFALALIDVVMETDTAGLDLVYWMRNEAKIKDTRIILRTGQPGMAPEKDVIMKYEINDYKEKSELTSSKLYSAVISSLRAYEDIISINDLVSDLSKSRLATLKAMAVMCESRDEYLGDHIDRVSTMSVAIARQLKYSGEDISDHYIELLGPAATQHDNGKISIPDEILNAPRRLNEKEFKIIEGHAISGAELLQNAINAAGHDQLLEMAQEIALTHHEKWDGSGYPSKLFGIGIPLCGRIVAIADVYDALRARRCYKDPMSPAKARHIIREESGKHFDPKIVDAFFAIVDDTEAGFDYGE